MNAGANPFVMQQHRVVYDWGSLVETLAIEPAKGLARDILTQLQ